MTRNRWAVLGLAALALVAMSAFVANGAQGESKEPEFTCLKEDHATHVGCTSTSEVVKMHREHNEEFPTVHRYTGGFGTITCEAVNYHVTTDADGTNATPKAEPTYENCEANPGHNQVHVATNGCEVQFHPEHTSKETKAEDEYTGTSSITTCNAESGGITITITNNTFTNPTNTEGGTKCLIHVPEQTGIGPIYFRTHTNEPPELTDMTVEADTAEAEAKFTGGFFNCGVFGENGTSIYTGNTTVRATNHDTELINLELD